ncbi:TonB-dependent receptor [Pseudothauera nasutitermitis]|uniref:TonB-dependent receptor n=1 Tax=Pseudothauera nasutitermitis TaxID=2565930 RepID=A0A4S4B364_9RHOO|nr:TonB-dependent receptor [Pseudothauera nasutitermitis]THF67090.1 TonB-dependent receptor [Pseudothauera nasutitermitis]
MQMGFTRVFTDGSPTPFSRNNNPTTDWSNWHNKRTTLSAALEHRFNEDWQAQLAYSHSSRDWAFKTGIAGGFLAPPLALDGMGIMSLRNNLSESRGDALDTRLNGRYTLWGRQHELVAGFNASDTDLKTRGLNVWDTGDSVQVLGWDGSGYPEPDWSAYTFYSSATRTKQSGAYLATHLHATDDLSFIVGARWSNWKTRALRDGAVTDDRKESSVFTPYAGIVYDLTRQVSAYVSYTEIFNPQSTKDVNGRLLAPETGKNLELGLKGEWFGGRLNASAAVFRSGKDNLAVADGNNQTSEGGQAYVAADDTKVRGLDVEVAGELAPGWQMQGGYTRTVLRDSSGQRLNTHMPKHQVKLFTTWTPANLNRLTVGGGVLWQSETYLASAGTQFSQKSYALVNLMANYAFDDHLSLALRLNNVFDKIYYTYPSSHYYGAPRNLYATLKYRF